LKITRSQEGSSLVLKLEGRLDTNTAAQLETELKGIDQEYSSLIFDFGALEYLSSAGLRVLLAAHKEMNKHGQMIVRNPNEMVLEILEMTGFLDFLTVE